MSKKSFRGAGCAITAVTGVSVLLLSVLAVYLWWGDTRDYDRFAMVTYGDGSLETVLTRYQVRLPDDVAELRFHDDESLVGSEGTLYLRFEIPVGDLAGFLHGLHMGADLKRGTPADWGVDYAFTRDMARGYGWRFDRSGQTWLWGVADASPSLRFSVVIEPHGTSDTVYLVGQIG